MSATQGLMTKKRPYSLQSYGSGFQIIRNGDCALDTNVVNRTQAEALVGLLNEAYQMGFSDCSTQLRNKETNINQQGQWSLQNKGGAKCLP